MGTMSDGLRALLIPPQEMRLRSRFGLEEAPLALITSGWHRLIIAASDRVFVFPRHAGEVPALEREADVLAALKLDIAPHLLGVHRDPGISPYPFLKVSRVPGIPYDTVVAALSFDDTARCLEDLGRRLAHVHQVAVPATLATRPAFLDLPRISCAWTEPQLLPTTIDRAAASLHRYLGNVPTDVWVEALHPIAELAPTTVHGEVSDGQFLIDARRHVTGLVDWAGLHVGHPLVDLDFGVGGYRICRWPARWPELRRRMWAAYVTECATALPNWRCVKLFWCLLDATTVLTSGGPGHRLGEILAELAEATNAFRQTRSGHRPCHG